MSDHGPLAALGYSQPDWHRDCLGREYPSVEFVPKRETPTSTARALQICGRCLVRPECLAWALNDPDLTGVLGGTDTAARRAMRHPRPSPTTTPLEQPAGDQPTEHGPQQLGEHDNNSIHAHTPQTSTVPQASGDQPTPLESDGGGVPLALDPAASNPLRFR